MNLEARRLQGDEEDIGRPLTVSEDVVRRARFEFAPRVCFRFIGAKLDYAGLSGEDPLLLSLTRDLFLHYRDKGERA